VYNGIDRARFRPSDKTVARQRLSLPDDREIVLYLGHLAEHKGVLDLIDAAQHLLLQRPRATILFVGDGPLSGRIRDRAASSPVAGSMLTYPTVSHAEVPLWMSAADVVCLPSWSEGMPNVVREAHACGRPVVATAVGGIPEAIPSPALGALVPPRNAPRLAQVLADRLDAPAIAPEEIAALARIPTWEESAHALHAVLQDVARASR
jgi:glycosyltransferase involved in cell wall biosynthesis